MLPPNQNHREREETPCSIQQRGRRKSLLGNKSRLQRRLAHLQSLGYYVTLKAATNAVSGDAAGRNFVMISSTVNAGDVTNKFTSNSIPVITWRQDLYDDLGMVTSNSSYYGTISGQTTLKIIDANHPLAAGLNGTITVESNASVFAWGTPNTNAFTIATSVSNPTNYVIFGYEKGARMPGLVAPARRVGLFMSDASSITNLNANGFALFDAAVNWVVTAPCPPALEVMLLLSRSSSMSGQPLTDAKNDAKYFATNLNLTLDRAGVAAYETSGELKQSLTTSSNLLTSAIDNIVLLNLVKYSDTD